MATKLWVDHLRAAIEELEAPGGHVVRYVRILRNVGIVANGLTELLQRRSEEDTNSTCPEGYALREKAPGRPVEPELQGGAPAKEVEPPPPISPDLRQWIDDVVGDIDNCQNVTRHLKANGHLYSGGEMFLAMVEALKSRPVASGGEVTEQQLGNVRSLIEAMDANRGAQTYGLSTDAPNRLGSSIKATYNAFQSLSAEHAKCGALKPEIPPASTDPLTVGEALRRIDTLREALEQNREEQDRLQGELKAYGKRLYAAARRTGDPSKRRVGDSILVRIGGRSIHVYSPGGIEERELSPTVEASIVLEPEAETG